MADFPLTDEARLVERAAAGDKESFRRLYDLYAPGVAAFVARRSPHDDVDDLVAETFVRAWLALPRFEWRGTSIRAWLFRIASRQLAERARRPARREVATATVEVPPIPCFDDGVVDRLTAQRRITRPLASLTPSQRAVVILRYADGLDVTETAHVLGISAESVRSRAHRGLQSLRVALATSGAQPPRRS
jgi:RNA polymerase sigma-70 factor (ECF subfamily)